MLRLETKARAFAIQLLYAWELQGCPPLEIVAAGFRHWGARGEVSRRGEALAAEIATTADRLDEEIGAEAEHWRLARIGTVERNILRLATHELHHGEAPPAVVIDEAVRLAQWFAGSKAPAFVNGVLDAVGHRLGRL